MTPHQPDLFGPTAAGSVGIQRSHDHAERDVPGWTEDAAGALRNYAAQAPRGVDFTIEEARGFVERLVGAPDELRAWGAVTQMAMRRKWIERTGSYRAAVSSNGSPKPTYRAGVL